MNKHVIGFAPPMQGFEGEWNTFRLGKKLGNQLVPGQEVFLMDNKESVIFGAARVSRVIVGRLGEMAQLHARHNHNQKANPEGAEERIVVALKKRYGPQMVDENRWVSVIYLEKIENEGQGTG